MSPYTLIEFSTHYNTGTARVPHLQKGSMQSDFDRLIIRRSFFSAFIFINNNIYSRMLKVSCVQFLLQGSGGLIAEIAIIIDADMLLDSFDRL